ncbi:MAG: DUF4981 domain-containing protein [Henriciella sp.]|nr:DUF4981 domain-containing protein [Henriciella sp.]
MSSLPLPLSQLFHPGLTSLGRLEARASIQAFPDEASLQTGASPWRMSLDGDWRFQFTGRPSEAHADWTASDTSQAPWRDIKVPGVWTRQDTGDLPHYANWQMPFDCQKPPNVPQDNPTGLYRRSITVPEAWQDRNTVLHIGGFESQALVWCNQVFIGMAKDSRLPSEFDLSEALRPGENELAIMVIRWCDATWIEDQDHWNHGGLHRSVWIESRGATHLSDLVVETDFDAETSLGKASVRAMVDGDSAGWSVHARLEAPGTAAVITNADAPVDQFDISLPAAQQWAQSFAFEAYAASLELQLSNAAPWSAEQPYRYRLITELRDPTRMVKEVHETWIGFTRIETEERRLRVNGRSVVLIGVNRHDHHPENGKTCSREDIRAELLTMKRHNINAIRTAHYPNDPALLDLADELGFYVIDEANVECHARWTEVSHLPEFLPAIVERTTRMIARDRNHPCIIAWSLGNEAGHGPAHDAAAAAARHLDPTRFVHYEGAVSQRFSFPFGSSPETTQQPPSANERASTDVVCPMYPPIDHIVDWARWAEQTKADDRPLILCEFSHAMGNSNGSLNAYVDAFFDEPALAGGFVWDWRDQGLAETDDQGRFYWAYGGHYGDEPNDANFNINGLVGPDGVPHPALREYMWAARPVTSELTEQRKLRVSNRRAFQDTSDLEMRWHLLKNGEAVESGQNAVMVAPASSIEIDLPVRSDLASSGDWHLDISWHLREDCAWVGAGHKVAWDQVSLQTEAQPSVETRPPSVDGGVFQHAGMTVTASEEGGATSISFGSDEPVSAPISLCLWRAPTDNDGGKPGSRPLFKNRTAEWVGYGLNALEVSAAVQRQISDGVLVERKWVGSDGDFAEHRSLWSVSDEAIVVDETIIIPEAWVDLPRVGLRFEIPSAYHRLDWFGLGSDESYPDRLAAQTIGRWSSTIEEQYHPYVRPQEYGAHEQCRWFQLTNTKGEGVRIRFPRPLSFTARPHNDADLNEAETLAELKPSSKTEVHVDVAMRGLGTGACGPDALPQYRVGPGTYAFRWMLQAVSGEA